MKLEERELPKGWEVKKFEDLLDYIQPTKHIVSSTEYSDEYETPVLTAGKSFIIGYTNEKNGIFDQLPVIIFDDFTTANKFVRFPFKVKSSAMKILKPKNSSVNIEFVFYYMQTVRITFDTHKRYWISVYSKISIPTPPPLEQQAIVAKIEELFSQLENGKQQLLTAQKQLKTYRQSLLKSAFEGKLTNQNLKDGESGWEVRNLGKSCDKILLNGIKIKQKDYLQNGKFPVVDQGQELIGGYFNDEKFLVPNDPPYIIFGDHTKVKKFINFRFVAGADGVKVIKPHSILDPKFFFYLIHTVKIPDKGYARHFQFLEKEDICFPKNILEQQKIVAILESKLTICDKIEETIKTSLQQSETLRQSILKKAFEGRLV